MVLDPRSTRHSFATALALATASGAAYDPTDATITAALPGVIGAPLVDFRSMRTPGKANGYLACFDKAIVLSFRGTDNFGDWLDDADIHLVPYRPGGLVHRGFRDYLDSVFDDVQHALDGWAGQGRTLWVTGHSLGAALAVLAAAYLRFPADPTSRLPSQIAGLYTFGQPRVGDGGFATLIGNDLKSFYFRYVNNQDIVTRIPPRVLSYVHSGTTEYIDPAGAIHDDPAWWQVFLDEVQVGEQVLLEMQSGALQAPAIDDHRIGNYMARITAAIAAGGV